MKSLSNLKKLVVLITDAFPFRISNITGIRANEDNKPLRSENIKYLIVLSLLMFRIF